MTHSERSERPKPRKTAKQSRSADTVAVILEAAARILEAEGEAGFTTNAVAERAGVSVGSLYQYFPNKAALVAALLKELRKPLFAAALAARDLTSGRAALVALIRAAVAHQLERPVLARRLDVEEMVVPFDPETRFVVDNLRDFVKTALRRRDLGWQGDPDVASRDLVALVKGMIDAAGEQGERDAKILEARVSRAVFGYLGADPVS